MSLASHGSTVGRPFGCHIDWCYFLYIMASDLLGGLSAPYNSWPVPSLVGLRKRVG